MRKSEAKIEKNNFDTYNPGAIEPKWQSKWENEEIYQPNLESANSSLPQKSGKQFYNLMMFPYPSAEGLHVGSVFAFSGADIYGRFKRMNGSDVFEPMGLDGFGIHSENHALKTGTHPIDHAKRTEKNFYRQLHLIGNSFAWKQKLETYDPEYYKWTQWLFVQLFKAGLAYRKKSPVNFCPSCMTVLADEQAVEKSKIKNQKSKINKEEIILEEKIKVCERCDTPVEKRELEQWFFRITKYAERLDANITKLNWSEKVKIAQKNWIGRSVGARIEFKIQNSKFKIDVFTTALDTIYGVTFMVISPEHPLIKEILKPSIPAGRQVQDDILKKSVLDYIDKSKAKSEIERQAEGKEKTGVFSGIYAIHPLTGEKIPVWIADYVLMGYGTGAVMGVPGHDARDHEFALKFKLEIIPVIRPKNDAQGARVEDDGFWNYSDIKTTFKDKSELFNSGQMDGLSSYEAKRKLELILEEKGFGKKETTFRLRDWLISRQRYWGPPIPMIYCEKCAKEGNSWFTTFEANNRERSKIKDQSSKTKGKMGNWRLEIGNSAHEMNGWFPEAEEKLPVELPYVKDFKPMGTGKSPLANYPEFYETSCPKCGSKARRETDVSDTFLDSSWYFLRYLAVDWEEMPFPSEKLARSANNELRFADIKRRQAFLPVTMYIGGAEHSVLHLMYARFVTMALCDLGYLNFEEPFSRFYAHGLIIKDGAKMSKSRGNVINPDEYISKYGSDTLRMYLHFLGPFNEDGDFKDSGVEGMHRFLKRVWTLFQKEILNSKFQIPISEEGKRMMHGAIAGVTDDLEHLRYNTAIARLMSWYNFLAKRDGLSREEAENYLKLLAPFAPHLTEELYQSITGQITKNKKSNFESIHVQQWPTYSPKFLVESTVSIAVQINGKLRDTITFQKSDIKDQKDMESLVSESGNVKKYLTGKNIRKVIYVPGRVINFVVTDIEKTS